jgi:hypothetical protein
LSIRPATEAGPGESWRFEQPKILVKDTSKDFAGTYDSAGYYVKDVLIIVPREGETAAFDLRCVAGVVNSRALHFFYRSTFETLHVQRGELASLPLPQLDLSNEVQQRNHDRLVQLVEAMLKAKAQVSNAKTESDRTYLEDKCAGLDLQIDQLVYELYHLTPEEIALVESHEPR